MKKLIKLEMILLVLLSLVGCSNNKNIILEDNNTTSNNEVVKLVNNTQYSAFSKYVVNNKQPYVFLVNNAVNNVYMQFDVYNNDDLLWSSKLVSPDHMETLNVYNILDEGEYNLDYSISTYRLDDMKPIRTGVHITQEIIVSKERS